MLRRTALAATALVAAAALALTACTAGGQNGQTGSGTPDADATVSIRLVAEPGNLDIRSTAGAALDQILIDNVYQGLVGRTPDQQIVPVLASDYQVSSDGLTYTFTLRDGVTFHDGKPLTPADVVWSLTQERDTTTNVDSANLSRVKDIAASGQTITLTLSQPDSSLLFHLSGRAGLVLEQAATNDLKTTANGTGPFTLASWKQGDSITLDRFDGYWDSKPAVKEVVLDFIPDNQTALTAALAGELDVVTGFDANLKSQIESGGDFSLVLGESTDKGTLAMNSTRPYLSDQRVRQAIRQAIDHDAIVKALGAGQTLYGPIPSLDPGYEDLSSTAPFDPAAARALLAEAGASNIDLTLTIPSFYGSTVSQILVSNLNDVGITLTVDAVDFPTWIQDVYVNKDYDLSFELRTEARDVDDWANPDYYFTYGNPQVLQLYQQSLASLSDDEAAGYLAQAAKIVAQDAAADWLYNGASIVAVGRSIGGMPSVNVNERLNLASLTKSAG